MMATTKAHKTSLTITLTESVVFLRGVDISGRRQVQDNAPPSMLRGLLTLDLAKATRISSIDIELEGTTVTSWPEGVGVRRTDIQEEQKLFSASQVFFRAPATPSTSRRTLSVGPGLSFYRDELEHPVVPGESDEELRRPTELFPVDVPEQGTLPRGRGRARRRLSADHSIYQRDPVSQRHNSHSPPPAPSPLYTSTEELTLTPTSVVPVTSSHERSFVHSPVSARSSLHFTPIGRPVDLPSTSEYESRSLSRPPSHPSSRAASRSRPSLATPSSASSIRFPPDGELSRRTSIEEEHRAPSRSQSRGLTESIASAIAQQQPSPVRGRSEPSVDDPRGRKNARFSLVSVSNSILDAVKERVRSNSPAVDRRVRSIGPKESEASRSRAVDKDKEEGKSHFHTLVKVGEALGLEIEDEHKEAGDGWREFKKGTYTFPISFAIPSHMPPSLVCDYGSVIWRLKSNVHRPGAFTPKLSATRDIVLVASPSEDDTEDTENIVVERMWDDQMSYLLSISGRMFAIGATLPINLSFLPLTKMKIHRISVLLEERIEYYAQMKQAVGAHSTNRFTLLNLRAPDKHKALLPLDSDDPHALENTPLQALVGADDDASEVAAGIMGPGPWAFHTELPLPAACGLLHFTNNNKKSNIRIHHLLKIMIRVERGDDLHIDPKTNKRKQFDIVVQTPVHILSCLSNSQRTSLPRYSETLSEDIAPRESPCSCAIKRHQAVASTSAPLPLLHTRPSPSYTLEPTSSRLSTEETTVEDHTVPLTRMDSVYARNLMFERLITGQQSELGEFPPAYELAAR